MAQAKNSILLFTDGSVNTKSKIGFGAYLLLFEPKFTENIEEKIKLKKFDNTSSSKLELQILLFALNQIADLSLKILVYTDSQNIINLPKRKEKLVEANFFSKNGIRLNNFELYQQFYFITSNLNIEFIKVKGHLKPNFKDEVDAIFSLVDKASRKALRAFNLVESAII